MNTLPDFLRCGLDIVLVGLNPSLRSVADGHYFASPRNRFWRAVNRSSLLSEPLDASTDYLMPSQGIGFTDVVKRPTRSASELRAADFRREAPLLLAKLMRFAPRIVCFQGMVAYRNFLRYSQNGGRLNEPLHLGRQEHSIGASVVYVTPNPSAANAAYSLDALVCWYDGLAALRDALKEASGHTDTAML